MPLKVPKRPAGLGTDLNVKHTLIKNDPFSRLGIPVVDVSLTADEFGAVLLNDKAPKHFWKAKRGRESELMYPHLGVQQLNTTIRDCTINLWLQDKILTLQGAKITGGRFYLQATRSVLWSFKIQAVPNLDDLVLSLLSTLSQPILIEIDCPTWGAQQELPLEADEEEGEGEEDGDQKDAFGPPDELGDAAHRTQWQEAQGTSRIQSQIEASEDKRAAKAPKAKKPRKKKS